MRGTSIAGRTGDALLHSSRASTRSFSQSCLGTRQPLPRSHNRIGAASRTCPNQVQARFLHASRQTLQQPADNKPYRPAQTWAGLEMIGGEKDWDTGKTFHPFGASHQLSTPEEITMAIYRAIVEVYTVEIAGQPQTPFGRPVPGALVNDTAQVKLSCNESADGERRVQLKFPSQDAIGNIVAAINENYEVSADTPAAEPIPNYTAESLAAQLQAIGREWLHVPLTNHSIKLAVVRRVKQLTGLHIPDRVIDRARSVSYLVTELAIPPSSPKLAEQLVESELAGITNIQLFGRRHTPVDKEREVGRLKVIQQQLKEHGMRPMGRQ